MSQEKLFLGVLDLLTTRQPESITAEQEQPIQRLRAILDQPNVIGVGISRKVREQTELDELALTFYVEKKLKEKDLPNNHIIPRTLPKNLSNGNSLVTDVYELGQLALDGPPYFTRSPIQPGYSCGHCKVDGGTLGAIVRKAGPEGGEAMYILSNSHILALSGKGKRGDAILYPGKADGGITAKDKIASLQKHVGFVPGGAFVNEVDCAIAKLDKINDVEVLVRGCQAPKGITAPRRGMKVKISGRTSGVSAGVVKDVNLRFAITYPGIGSVGFRDQILCSRYSRKGDSGALVFEQGSGRAVGLHFAGAHGGSVCCPIDKVLTQLGIVLALVPG